MNNTRVVNETNVIQFNLTSLQALIKHLSIYGPQQINESLVKEKTDITMKVKFIFKYNFTQPFK